MKEVASIVKSFFQPCKLLVLQQGYPDRRRAALFCSVGSLFILHSLSSRLRWQVVVIYGGICFFLPFSASKEVYFGNSNDRRYEEQSSKDDQSQNHVASRRADFFIGIYVCGLSVLCAASIVSLQQTVHAQQQRPIHFRVVFVAFSNSSLDGTVRNRQTVFEAIYKDDVDCDDMEVSKPL